jgi:TetR/AcrR family transcriptional regulator, transcriptional repressor for nem operon
MQSKLKGLTMRVSRTQAEENRQTVINVASRLFREHGFDGIGLKELMKGAGLTQGAFYKQFASKEDLAAQASQRALEYGYRRLSEAAASNPEDPLGAVIAFYLSPDHRAEKMNGCPLAALASDAARQGFDVKASFEAGIMQDLAMLESCMGDAAADVPAGRAMAALSTMVGAMILARAVNDPDLAQRFLDTAADQVRAAAARQDSAAPGFPAGKRQYHSRNKSKRADR